MPTSVAAPGTKSCVASTAPPSPGKPVVDVPLGPPPTELVSTDLTVGDGAEAKPHGNVTVQYVGIACSTGKQFDSSWDRGEPATFPLDGVIAGWSTGIPGMKVGGRRMLVIPPDLAYGSRPPSGSGIAPGETLIFVVDLVSVA